VSSNQLIYRSQSSQIDRVVFVGLALDIFEHPASFNVRASFAHVCASGRAYWHAWAIAIAALTLSFAGMLFLGVGFLFTNVWFWQIGNTEARRSQWENVKDNSVSCASVFLSSS